MPSSDYEVELFRTAGFTRQQCVLCGSFFWGLSDRSTCGESPCQEYDFIGAPPTKKSLTARAMREDFLGFLETRGHTRVNRYPIVARWRDDVFFTQASIYPFQPWVVNGDASPPANPLAIAQPCARFEDVHNVGRTGGHFTMFEMMAHHAFNFPNKPVYYKDRTVELCQEFLTSRLGIHPTQVTYKESWWEGGGNSGPCFEVIVGGAEPATLVFMENRETNGHRVPMDTQVVDTGYGLERLTWLSQGTPSAYEAVFGDTLAYLKRAVGARPEEKVLREYGKVAGLTKVKTMADLREIRQKAAERIGISLEDLQAQVEPLERVYLVCDHTRALMFLLGDGVVPSNSQEGYFARLLVRRVLRALRSLDIGYTAGEILSFQIDEFREDYPELWRAKREILRLLEVEQGKYAETLVKGRGTVARMEGRLKASERSFDLDALIELYDSHGLSPEVVAEFTDLRVDAPDDFYTQVAARHMQKGAERPKVQVPGDLPPTRLRVYENRRKRTFTAKVVAIQGRAIVLDQTYFYPEGGGQESDRGRIGDWEVVDVQKVGPSVLHFVRGEPELPLGKRVKCEIDWTRRTSLTRNHSATHILLGASRKVLGDHIWQSGAHKGQDLARLDITHYEGLSDDQFREIERLANDVVLSDRPVRVRNLPRDQAERKYGFRLYQGGSVPGGTVRVIEVPEWDVEACGGTHVARTSEVGVIKLLRSRRVQDGVVRLEYVAGRPALETISAESRILASIGEELSVPVEDAADTVRRLHAEWRDQRRELDRLSQEGATDKVDPLLERAERIGPARVVVHRAAATMQELMALSRRLTERPDVVAILGGEGATASLIVSRGSGTAIDCSEIIQRAAGRIQGRGGGKADFAQGGGPHVAGLGDALDTALEDVRRVLTDSA